MADRSAIDPEEKEKCRRIAARLNAKAFTYHYPPKTGRWTLAGPYIVIGSRFCSFTIVKDEGIMAHWLAHEMTVPPNTLALHRNQVEQSVSRLCSNWRCPSPNILRKLWLWLFAE